MPDVLIFADIDDLRRDAARGAGLVPDPFLYAEKDGKQMTAVDRRSRSSGSRPWESRRTRCEEFGYDELLAQGVPRWTRSLWHTST